MAIDMKTVKEIEFNNKQVKKIEDSNGNILWQKKSATTVTITLTNLKYIDLYCSYWYKNPFVTKGEIRYLHLNYTNITGVSDTGDTDAFVLLPLEIYQNIKNKSYTDDTTITGINSFTYNTAYCICYVSDNELYCVGSMKGVNNGPVRYSSDTTGFTYTYKNVSWYSSYYCDADMLYGSNSLYMTGTGDDPRIAKNTNTPHTATSTNGGVTPKLRAASGTMTLQYTI